MIAYALTCACVDFYSTVLKQLPEAAGLVVKSLHGRMKQSQRQATLAAFSAADAGALPLDCFLQQSVARHEMPDSH